MSKKTLVTGGLGIALGFISVFIAAFLLGILAKIAFYGFNLI